MAFQQVLESAPERAELCAKQRWLAALLLVAATLGVYWTALSNDFVDFDDGAYVTQNPQVRGGLSAEGLRWAFAETHSSNWHPLTWLSHMLDCELYGLEPRGHHLMSVALHALASALCFWALLLLTRRSWPSLLVAAFFALHPQRVESVAWVSERKDVLSGVFFFACLCAYGSYARRGGRLAYTLLLLSFSLGLLAKQMLVSLPCLLLVLDFWPLGRFKSLGIKRCLLEKAPLLGLALAAGWMTLAAQGAGGAISSLEALPLDVRLANALWATGAYMGKMLWPVDLAFFYPLPYLVLREEYVLWNASELGAAALLLGISVLAVLTRRGRPWILCGWLWYLGLLAPVVGIIQVGGQSMADRYAYLPTIGLYIAIVWSAAELARSAVQRRGLVILGLLLALAMIPVTQKQIATWKDSPALFEHAIETTGRNYIAHSNYGFYLHQRGQLDAAEGHYLEALKHSPRLVDALSNLGAIYIDRKHWGQARAKLQEALSLNPNFMDALMLLGLLEESTGRDEAALAVYGRALQRRPAYLLGITSKARVLRQLGRADESLALLQAARGSGAEEAELWIELGATQRSLGSAALAQEAYERGLSRHASHSKLRLAAADFYATTQDAGRRDGQRALHLLAGIENPGAWNTLRVLAASKAASGDFEAARRSILEATVLAPEDQRAGLTRAYALYQQKKLQLE